MSKWPAILFLIIMAIDVVGTLARNGQPRTGKYSITTALIVDGIVFALLYWGGFFDVLFK